MQSHLRAEIAAIRMEVAEATLTDVSRDLHDEVGQLLTFGILQLENMASKPEHEKMLMIAEVKQSVRDALDSIRSISRGLSPDFVNQQGLAISLDQLLERARSRAGIKTSLNVQSGFSVTNSSNQIIVFRIIRECITNAIRHGQATDIVISMKTENTNAIIAIHDNGIGLRKVQESIPTLGFNTMQQYAGLMNGNLTFTSNNGDGTTIILNFPNNLI